MTGFVLSSSWSSSSLSSSSSSSSSKLRVRIFRHCESGRKLKACIGTGAGPSVLAQGSGSDIIYLTEVRSSGTTKFSDGRTDDGRTDDERMTNEKKTDEKIRTKKISDEKKFCQKNFRPKTNLDEKNWGQGTGARHGRCGGKAWVINGDSWGAKPPRPSRAARHG